MGTETRVTAGVNRPFDRRVAHLTVVDFTPLPTGWRNVYRADDGTVFVEDCPGVLTVHESGYTLCWDEVDEAGQPSVVTHDVAYDKVEVTWRFASRDDVFLVRADDSVGYEKTVGPSESVD